MLSVVVPLTALSACGTVSLLFICHCYCDQSQCRILILTSYGIVVWAIVRSGQAHRTLVGHTGPLTSLQFDDYHVVSGSMDRSVRVRPIALCLPTFSQD